MTDYQQTFNPLPSPTPHAAGGYMESVIRLDDGAVIPNDPGNVDWQAYQAWLALGNQPLPPEPPPKGPPTLSDVVAYQMLYRAKTNSVAITDPGNGNLVWNTAAQVDATHIVLDAQSGEPMDQSNVLRSPMIINMRLAIQHVTNAAIVQRFDIMNVTDMGGWFDLGVEPVSAEGGAFGNNNPLLAMLIAKVT